MKKKKYIFGHMKAQEEKIGTHEGHKVWKKKI
jgi:hypothetical protein